MGLDNAPSEVRLMNKNLRYVNLLVAVGAVTSALLGGAGCASICNSLGFSKSEAPVAPQPTQVAFAPEPAKSQAPADGVLNSTQPRFDNDWQGQDVTEVVAKPVNLFGEIGGASRGAFKEVGASGFQQHTFVDEGEDGDVSVDPTGKWLVFSSTRHSETGDIYLQRVDGSSVTQLTSDAARDAFPTFSPDGKWIAFSSTRSGTWQIYRMDLDGREVVQVTSGPLQAIHPSFSPDGTRLVYCALGARSQQWELWTVNLLSGERRQVGYGLFPRWSPDKANDRIAYQRARQRGSRWFSLWTMDLVNGEGRRNTEVAVSSNAAIVSPCWSPDGKKLAFTTVVQPAEAGTTKGQQDVWTVDADGSNKHRLTDGNGSNLTPAWAADNRVYFISNRGGNESIWSVKANPVDTFTASAGKGTKAPAESAEATVDTKEVTH
jgi:TolB protein